MVLQYFQKSRLYQNGWSFSISRKAVYTKMVGPSVFPDTRVIPKCKNFQYFQIHGSLKLLDFPYVPVPTILEWLTTQIHIDFICFSHYFHIFATFWAQIPIPASSIQWILQSSTNRNTNGGIGISPSDSGGGGSTLPRNQLQHRRATPCPDAKAELLPQRVGVTPLLRRQVAAALTRPTKGDRSEGF